MNQMAMPTATASQRCRDIALAALGSLLPAGSAPSTDEARFLQQALAQAGGLLWPQQLTQALALPAAADEALARAATLLGLSAVEILAVALTAAVEDDALTGRILAWMQAPTAGARPTLALLARALAPLLQQPDDLQQAEADTLYALAFGPAVRSGLLLLDDEGRPLCERSLRVAAPIAAALAGVPADWPGSRVRAVQAEAALVDSVPALRAAADRWAASLAATPQATLAMRSASAAEARGMAMAVIERLGGQPAWFDDQLPAGADVWLMLTGRVPVFALQAAPGELAAVPPLPGYAGPVLVTTGLDGGIFRDEAAVADWRIPAPDPATRGALWLAALGDTELAASAAARYRAGVAQISEHAKLAQLLAAGQPSLQTIAEAASMTSAGRALDALAQALPEVVADGALVVNEAVGAELERALQRCAQRERLHAGLGEAARTRACDGVRLLFTGLSGTGKSLAGQWLAARLGLPIYRVDLAAMLSKWIGDTEKNLAELLGRAEHADVVLLFDEADTLFGKRTEIATANDRFANAQTNYLLQRIESHAGIVVLTSNSRNRFDPAFVRRLDFIIDFSAPDAQARRALWQAHLGDASSCDQQQLNRLAALADLAGGNIRNAVLAAAASAQAAGRRLGFDDIAAGVRGEYRKLGRTAPPGL